MTLPAGLWRHYKGPLYLLVGVAHDANADTLAEWEPESSAFQHPMHALVTREVVVYVPLQLDGAHLGPRMAVRTRADWEATVCTVDGCPHYGDTLPLSAESQADCDDLSCPDCHDLRHQGPRFTYVGEHLTAEHLPHES